MAVFNMMPPGTAPTTATIVNGRSYSCARGAVLTNVPPQDADVLEANGWVKTARDGGGATSGRPANPLHGATYHDTTLGITVVWDHAAWRNPVTGAIV